MAIEVKVPDIGDFKDVPVIEIHVKAGDSIKADDPLVTLESDKATMDVPADRRTARSRRSWSRSATGSARARAVAHAEGRRRRRAGDAAALGDRPAGAGSRAQADRGPAGAAGPAAAAAADAGPGPCQPQRAPARARARGRPRQGQGHRREGPDHQGRRQGVPARPRGPGGRRAAPGGRHGHPRDPGPGLLQVRPDRDQAAGAHQAHLRGPLLHRAWLNIPHVTHGDEADITELEAYRKELDDAAKADKKATGSRCWPFLMKASVSALQGLPRVQQLARAREGQPDLQEVLQCRHRRRHAGRAGRAGGQGRRPQGHRRAEQGAGRDLEEGARRQAGPGRHAGRHLHHLVASAASAAPTSRRSSTRPRWRSWAWCARRWPRSGTARSSSRG